MNIYISATFTIVFCFFLCKMNSFCIIFFLCSNPYIFVAAALDWILIPSCTSNSSLLLLQGHNFHQVLPFNFPPKILQTLKWCCITKQAATSFRRMLTLLTLGDSHTASSWKTTCCCSNPWGFNLTWKHGFQMSFNIDSLKPPTNLTSWCGWSLTTRDLDIPGGATGTSLGGTLPRSEVGGAQRQENDPRRRSGVFFFERPNRLV